MKAASISERCRHVATQKKNPPPLLTLRSTVILFVAAIAAGVTGVGTYLGTKEPLMAVATSGGTFAAATAWLNKNIGT